MKNSGYLVSIFLTVFGMLLWGCTIAPGPNGVFGSGKGSIQIKVAGLPQRTTQTSLSDIDHIRIDLEAAGNATASQTLTKAFLYNSNASASVVFPDLCPGDATVSVTVFNNANANIGLTTVPATVVSNQVTALNLTLKLSTTSEVTGNLLVVGTILPGATPTPTPSPTAIPSATPTPADDPAVFYIDSYGGDYLNEVHELQKIYSPMVYSVRVVNRTLDQTLYLFIIDFNSWGDNSFMDPIPPGQSAVIPYPSGVSDVRLLTQDYVMTGNSGYL
jgi:hypothetical protein